MFKLYCENIWRNLEFNWVTAWKMPRFLRGQISDVPHKRHSFYEIVSRWLFEVGYTNRTAYTLWWALLCVSHCGVTYSIGATLCPEKIATASLAVEISHHIMTSSHQMETFSALLAICAGNSPVPVNSPQKASDAELWCFLWSASEKRLNKQSWGCWFETQSSSLWRHCS